MFRFLRKSFIYTWCIWSAFVLFTMCGAPKIFPKKFDLIWHIKPIRSIPFPYYNGNFFDFFRALDRAATDKRVNSLKIILNHPINFSLAQVQEISKIIRKFKVNRKKVYFWADNVESTSNFLFFSSADFKLLGALGSIITPGYEFSSLFYGKKNMDEGIDFWAFQGGEYKAGVLNQLGTKFSTNVAENIKGLLDDLISQARNFLVLQGFSSKEAEDCFKEGFFGASEAKSLGLITENISLKTYSSFFYNPVNLEDYSQGLSVTNYIGPPQVALIRIDFTIDKQKADFIIDQISRLKKMPSIACVIIWVDSGGGAMQPSMDLDEAIDDLKKSGKFVYGLIDNIAASGGYLVISGADKIFSNSASITGSIGLYSLYPQTLRALAKDKIFYDSIKTHDGSFGILLSQKQKDFLKKEAEKGYEYFLDLVSKRRRISPSDMRDIGRGQIYSGLAAKKIGLVDSLDGLSGLMAEIAVKFGYKDFCVKFIPSLGFLDIIKEA